MDMLHPRCCGLDAHKNSISACILVQEAGRVQKHQRRFGEFFELDQEGFARTLDDCATFLKLLGCNEPHQWIVGFEGMKERQLVVRSRSLGECVSNVVEHEGTLADGDKAADKLRPFFELVYDRCGRTTNGQLLESSEDRWPTALVAQEGSLVIRNRGFISKLLKRGRSLSVL
jgi:hypothetical protein